MLFMAFRVTDSRVKEHLIDNNRKSIERKSKSHVRKRFSYYRSQAIQVMPNIAVHCSLKASFEFRTSIILKFFHVYMLCRGYKSYLL